MVFLSSRISPFTSTVIFFERSPLAMAVVTRAMLRTWLVRFDARKLTLSVRSFHVPATPCTSACAPSERTGAGQFRSEGVKLIDHRVDGVLQGEDFAARLDGDLLREVAVGDGRRDFGDVADLIGEVACEDVDVVGQVLPRACDAGDGRLRAE